MTLGTWETSMRVDDNEPLLRRLPAAFSNRWRQAAFDLRADDANCILLRGSA